MALTNAERQQRWREKMKAAAREGTRSSTPSVAMTLPAALALRYTALTDEERDGHSVARLVDVAKAVMCLEAFHSDIEPDDPVVATLGGPAYVRDVIEWQRALRERQHKRKNKGPELVAPPLPGVT
jgi:urease gamma subunit